MAKCIGYVSFWNKKAQENGEDPTWEEDSLVKIAHTDPYTAIAIDITTPEGGVSVVVDAKTLINAVIDALLDRD